MQQRILQIEFTSFRLIFNCLSFENWRIAFKMISKTSMFRDVSLYYHVTINEARWKFIITKKAIASAMTFLPTYTSYSLSLDTVVSRPSTPRDNRYWYHEILPVRLTLLWIFLYRHVHNYCRSFDYNSTFLQVEPVSYLYLLLNLWYACTLHFTSMQWYNIIPSVTST